MSAGWMAANLGVQGYCLTADESRSLRWGLRFPTALCLAIVIVGLARHAFKLATVWLLAVGLLFVFGDGTAGLVLGGILVGVCGLVTVTNFCIPSTLLGVWWRWRGAVRLAESQ